MLVHAVAAVVLTAGSLFDFELTDVDGKARALREFEGKVVLVVNVASRCGLTPQYEGLEALYQKHSKEGLVVIGMPSNDFGSQEPGTEAEIKEFCTTKYDVTFPMFAKVHVNGDSRHALYSWLIAEAGGGDIEWNFGKFLVGRDGQVIARFGPRTKPDSESLTGAIEKALGIKGA